jgi:hypothetical protein
MLCINCDLFVVLRDGIETKLKDVQTNSSKIKPDTANGERILVCG